jgi:DNA-binding CsgD family transcriptional regulator
MGMSNNTIDLSKHFCLENSEQLKAINKPLELLGIDCYCYTSLDLKTGKRYLLTDHPRWTQFAYNSGFYGVDIVKKIESTGCLESFMWSDFMHNKEWRSVLTIGKEFGLCHGITFIQHTDEKLNVYYAGTSDENLNDQHIINVSQHLLDYIPYFHYAAKDLINESSKHQFSVRDPALDETPAFDPATSKLFYDAIQVKQLVINDQGDHLTHQEALCAYLAISGKTTKIISEILQISVRTVEKHILHVRKKFGVKINETLLGKLFDSIYLNHIVFYGVQCRKHLKQNT